jgi:hypothetical protein
MSNDQTHLPPPSDLSGWRSLPRVLMVIGGLLCVISVCVRAHSDAGAAGAAFGIAWLFAFIFFLTISLGALFLVMVHHLTDAGWSVGIRRFCEHLASLLFPWLAILFIPIALMSKLIYKWLTLPPTDELIRARWPVFSCAGFLLVSAIFFAIWWILSSQLSRWSLEQDKTGAAECTRKMRFYSGWGIVAFALTATYAAALWMESLQYQWYSAIHGVYFFGSCAWIGLATVYVIAAILYRQGSLRPVLKQNYFYFIGVLFFAFTLFQAYAEFAQYFVVWNANIPQETFYYLVREHGNWWWLSLLLIFGHVFLPFFVLLPVNVKTSFKVVIPVCLWAWFMHAVDLAFNIFPARYHDGFPMKVLPLWIGCLMFMGGFLGMIFVKKFNAHPPFPQKDPRLLEAMGVNTHVVDDMVEAQTAGGSR